MKNLDSLFKEIMDIGGNRMVTIATTYMGVDTYDISPNNMVGYTPEHLSLFSEHLEEAISNGGGIMIRKFSEHTYIGQTPHGMMTLPVKHLYAAVGGQKKWMGLNKSQVKQMSNTDSATGKPINAEEGVRYCDWPTDNTKQQ